MRLLQKRRTRMSIKKILKNFVVAGLIVVVTVGVASAAGRGLAVSKEVCDLIKELQGIFKLLRTIAFIGAAFFIAGWAWGWLAAGEFKMDEAKKKGIALLVGFLLLFSVGILLSIALSGQITGCAEFFSGWN